VTIEDKFETLSWAYNSSMLIRITLAGCLSAALSLMSHAQTMAYSPMGGIVTNASHPQLSSDIQSQLPKAAVAQLDIHSHMNSAGEEVIVYSLDEHDMDCHIAVFRDGKLVNDFSLHSFADPNNHIEQKFMEYQFFSYLEVPAPSSTADIFSFHNYGDGAGTVLVVLAPDASRYKVALFHQDSHSQIRYFSASLTAELWDGDDYSCVWCPAHFMVSKLAWKNGTLVVVSKFTKKGTFSPYPMSDQPIRLIQRKSPPSATVKH
jgi:hypothetical protein